MTPSTVITMHMYTFAFRNCFGMFYMLDCTLFKTTYVEDNWVQSMYCEIMLKSISTNLTSNKMIHANISDEISYR
jgi:hypothetical protein